MTIDNMIRDNNKMIIEETMRGKMRIDSMITDSMIADDTIIDSRIKRNIMIIDSISGKMKVEIMKGEKIIDSNMIDSMIGDNNRTIIDSMIEDINRMRKGNSMMTIDSIGIDSMTINIDRMRIDIMKAGSTNRTGEMKGNMRRIKKGSMSHTRREKTTKRGRKATKDNLIPVITYLKY